MFGKLIAWHATESGLCHEECEAYRTNCPWALMMSHQTNEKGLRIPDWSLNQPGEICHVYLLLTMLGRSTAPQQYPTCASCPYFDANREECHERSPVVMLDRAGGVSGYHPPVSRSSWCGKHPQIEALKMRAALGPAQSVMSGMFAELAKLKDGG